MRAKAVKIAGEHEEYFAIEIEIDKYFAGNLRKNIIHLKIPGGEYEMLDNPEHIINEIIEMIN